MSVSGSGVAKAEKPVIGSVRRSFAPWKDPNIKPLIRYESVIKRFGDFVAIKKLDLDITRRSSSPSSAPPAAARPP